ncbi:CapA family protein [Sphingomonas sp.]|uniref:CapA family protein n=1 Tax=Sphingomonas sp. TaxID=28214 RepID=UPI001B0D863D|nr:CapA family protein [Sphingomonas sp.]MBO9713323.1 CapA family protein [Sphingomonas sp.]
MLVRTLAACLLLATPAAAQDARSFGGPMPPRDQRVELGMKIRERFTVVAVGDMIQMAPFAQSDDPDIAYLVKLMRDADLTLANNENFIVDHDSYRGPIGHQRAPATIADDWARMGIDMVTKANNHAFDGGEPGLWADFRELARVGIVHTGADYNLTEARMTRSFATPKGSAGLIGVYAASESTSRMSGIATGDPIYVDAAQLAQLRAMRDAIVARRGETPNPIDVPHDLANEVTVFGTAFRLRGGGEGFAGEHPFSARQTRAKAARGEITSRTNDLDLVTYNGVTAAQLAQLRAIAGVPGTGDTLEAFGTRFKVTPGPGEYDYAMKPQPLRDILREVRTGKQFNDFLAVTAHWHQNRFAFQRYSDDHYPPTFEIEFAHAAIDQGADLFFAHGMHTLKGVEIYKGKPIFYGLSNFVFQSQQLRTWADEGELPPASPDGPIVGEGETNERAWSRLQQPDNLVALLTRSRYEKGRLAQVRLYPVELGPIERPGSQLGTPRRPSPAAARRILEQVIDYSRPFGTKIRIEGGVGVIDIGAGGTD